MKSHYDLYEYREITKDDLCWSYDNLGLLAPVLTHFHRDKKWGMVWQYTKLIKDIYKHSRFSNLIRRREGIKCISFVEEFYKRVKDVTPMRTWK